MISADLDAARPWRELVLGATGTINRTLVHFDRPDFSSINRAPCGGDFPVDRAKRCDAIVLCHRRPVIPYQRELALDGLIEAEVADELLAERSECLASLEHAFDHRLPERLPSAAFPRPDQFVNGLGGL